MESLQASRIREVCRIGMCCKCNVGVGRIREGEVGNEIVESAVMGLPYKRNLL